MSLSKSPPLRGCDPVQRDYTTREGIDVMTRQQVLDLYFLDARSKLIDLAAFLDRVERASGEDDFRIRAFRDALRNLSGTKQEKAREVLLIFSDPTSEPIAKASTKGACGAFSTGEN